MSSHPLREASLHVVKGSSVVAPLMIAGLPEEIQVLGDRWWRKREFHLTAISIRTIERGGGDWRLVRDVASGRALGPISATADVRRVIHPDRADLRTLIVMAHAAGLTSLYEDLSGALGVELEPPPAHVTLYSSDPEQGIGIDTTQELEQRAPQLSQPEQEDVRREIGFDEVF